MERDLLHPTFETEKQRHKLKRIVQSPNSYFLDVRCPGCNENTVVFSHAQSTINCPNCQNVLANPTGGKCKLSEGTFFKIKE